MWVGIKKKERNIYLYRNNVFWIANVWLWLRPLLRLRPLLSISICLMDRGGLHRGISLLWMIHTLCHIHWMCFNSKSVLLYTWHLLFCPSWRGILLCCSPEGFFLFFPMKGYLGDFPDPMWGFGTGMSMFTDCKALSGKFVMCENGLYKINWIELNRIELNWDGHKAVVVARTLRWASLLGKTLPVTLMLSVKGRSDGSSG